MEKIINKDINDVVNLALTTYINKFHAKPSICSIAPGRVNLIGEHTDYNNGYVLPMALSMGTVIIGSPSGNKECHIFTTCELVEKPNEVNFQITDSNTRQSLSPGKPVWANYIKGVMVNFVGKLVGFNAVIASNVPVGGGLSSSAALEVATYCFLESLSNGESKIGLIDKALACQKAEHEFLGMPCGIMDQFISIMGKKDHVLLLDCRSLEYHLIKLEDPEISVLITNTNVRHTLAESQYSNRKKQCEKAAQVIGKASLRDVSLEKLENSREVLGEELYKRALHVVGEIKRTVGAAEALKLGNYIEFGGLMKESHASLRDNYEVSCPELDIVVEAALEVDGVFGSRMTGGGFGGCTVTLLRTQSISKVIENIKAKYDNPTFYVCRPGEGARLKELPLS